MLSIIFAGTPSFAVPSLDALINSEHRVAGVLTQPDRPKGRGRKLQSSPIKELALTHQCPVFQPNTLKEPQIQQTLKELSPDVMIVAAYGLLLPKAVLEIPRLGCLNIHGSLLPRWRGASPVQAAILAGDATTGVTIMQMNEGLDTGDMLHKVSCEIRPDHTTYTLMSELSHLGAQALLETLSLIEDNKLKATKQDDSQATHAAKIKKQDAIINWQNSAKQIARQVQAYNPWPGALSHLEQQSIKIFRAYALNEHDTQAAGTILNKSKQGLDVATNEGILRITELQFPGKTKQTADVFANNQKLIVGNQWHSRQLID